MITDNYNLFKTRYIANIISMQEKKFIKEDPLRCIAIKNNGKRCRQKNKLNQTGGEIINNFCDYHCKYRNIILHLKNLK